MSSKSSSEMRQRKGAAKQEKPAGGFEDDMSKEEVMEKINQLMTKMKAEPKPGLSNVAKKAKDALTEDPYNLQLIWDLGCAYSADNQWKQCANVMLRGWKRMSEIPDKDIRFQFLTTLVEASLQTHKYRQAHAVLSDIEVDDPPKMFYVLQCQVYCANGELQKGVKAFNAAIENESFDTVGVYWTACCSSLKKVGAFESTKSMLELKAGNDDDRKRLEALEKIAELKEAVMTPEDRGPGFSQKILLGVACSVAFGCFCYGLYLLEQTSLDGMKKVTVTTLE